MEEQNLIDDAFYIKEQRWGTFVSYDKNGSELVTSLTENQCVSATRYILKGRQEGFSESKTHSGTVDGKL